MLSAVDLDHYPELMTRKIGKVRTDRRLAPKVVRLEWRLPQILPELLLGFGRVATQGARAWHPPV
jgi:hypothetical protein